jgi:DNA-binding XRE family transcriptional regulator
MLVSGFSMPENTGILRPMKNKIRVFRAMHELTQEHPAKAIGVNRQTIIASENERYVPSTEPCV